MHHQIEALAYQNRLSFLPPSHKLLFATVLFILGYFLPPLWQILIGIWLSIWIVIYAQIPYQIYFKLLGIPFSFWLISLPALVFTVGFKENWPNFQTDLQWGIPLGSFYLYLSQQGIQQGITILTRAIALTSSLYFILLTTPFVTIIQLGQRLGFPPLLLELISLMYRFIFLLTDTVFEMLNAQKSRLGYRNRQTAIKSLALLLSQLLWRTLENYRQISLALTSRGFQGELRFWHSCVYRPSLRYNLEAIAGCLILLISWRWFSHYVN
jgi:cobalt/nickel transport system permease protein